MQIHEKSTHGSLTSVISQDETKQTETDFDGAKFILSLLFRRRFLIVGVTLLGGMLTALFARSRPDVFTATALIMLPQQPQSMASALLGNLGALSGVAGRELGLKSPSDLYLGILGSRTIADHIIARFYLKEVYKAKDMYAARFALQKNRVFSSGKDTLIHIDATDTDPSRAAAVANAYVEELNKQNRDLASGDAGQRRQFLERQLEQEKGVLTTAEDAMKDTQTQTGIVEIGAQAQITLAAIAQLRAKVAAGEVLLQRLRLGGTDDNPQVMQAEAEVQGLRSQLHLLERSSRDSSGDPMVSASAMPKSGLEYLRHLRDLKYHEFLFEMLSKQYEAARIDEGRSAPPVQVVDPAIVPERKSGPPRTLMTLIGLFVSSIFGFGIAALLEIRQRPDGRE
jgi:tyrosine-protein kinase Etk/Wzc